MSCVFPIFETADFEFSENKNRLVNITLGVLVETIP